MVSSTEKWITVKILRGLHKEIDKKIDNSRGMYANVPDFIEQACREKLERMR